MTLILINDHDNAVCRVSPPIDPGHNDITEIIRVLGRTPFPETINHVQRQVRDLSNSPIIQRVRQWKFCRLLTGTMYSFEFQHTVTGYYYSLLIFSSKAPLRDVIKSWD